MTPQPDFQAAPSAPAVPQTLSGSHAVGLAILAAAMSLPGIQAAHAETAPERGVIALKYLDYVDSQPDLTRVTVHSPSIMVMAPVAGVWSVEGSLTSDHVSGATPRYHTAVSSASRMSDDRHAGDLSVTRYFPNGTFKIGAAYSTEHDYQSRALSLQGSVSSEDKNTTWNFGIGGAADKIHPTGQELRDTKNTVDLMLGVTQVVTMQDIAQLTLTHTRGRGYFSDPYKTLDNRPRERNQSTLLARWNHHFSGTEGTSRLSYRYYTDSYQIKAHTIAAEYVQPLSQGWSVTPSLRLYSQSAASFYFDPDYAFLFFPKGYVIGSNQYISEDQRMSAFGARTLGIKLAKQIGRDWLVDLKLEAYEQRGSWVLSGKGSPGLEPLRARSFQIGLSRQF